MKTFYLATDPEGNGQGYDFYHTLWGMSAIVSVPSSGRKKPVDPDNPKTAIEAVADRNKLRGVTDINQRIYLVTGRPVKTIGHTSYFRQVRVLNELPGYVMMGPQGPQLSELGRKAADLPEEKLKRLMETHLKASNLQGESGITWYDLMTDAQGRAHEAANLAGISDSQWNLVQAAVVAPSYTVSKTIVEFTALGLMTRHLIGTARYTEKSYRTLVALWRTAVGELHWQDQA